MNGTNRARHCAKCDHDVENLSAMTESEAASWLAERSGHVCVRIDRDERGKILFALGAAALMAACSAPYDATIPDAGVTSPSPEGPVAQSSASSPPLATAAPPRPKNKRPPAAHATVGCVCVAGDPLCSCL